MHFLILENVDVPISQTQFQRVDFDSLDYDPRTRKQIWEYYVNQRDEIRQAYIKKGPHQPPEIFFFPLISGHPKLEILRPSLWHHISVFRSSVKFFLYLRDLWPSRSW